MNSIAIIDVGVLYYGKSMSCESIATYLGADVSSVELALKFYRISNGIVSMHSEGFSLNEKDWKHIKELSEIRKMIEMGYKNGQIGARLGYTEEFIKNLQTAIAS